MGILIKTSDKLSHIRESLKQQNLSVVLTNGCFDILHVGHIRYLQQAKSFGEILIIGVNSDQSVKKLKGDSRPINSELDRAEMLNALTCIDYTYIFAESTADKLIKAVQPNIYVKGGDYTLEDLPKVESQALIKLGCAIRFVSFHEGFSTTNTIEKIYEQKIKLNH